MVKTSKATVELVVPQLALKRVQVGSAPSMSPDALELAASMPVRRSSPRGMGALSPDSLTQMT